MIKALASYHGYVLSCRSKPALIYIVIHRKKASDVTSFVVRSSIIYRISSQYSHFEPPGNTRKPKSFLVCPGGIQLELLHHTYYENQITDEFHISRVLSCETNL